MYCGRCRSAFLSPQSEFHCFSVCLIGFVGHLQVKQSSTGARMSIYKLVFSLFAYSRQYPVYESGASETTLCASSKHSLNLLAFPNRSARASRTWTASLFELPHTSSAWPKRASDFSIWRSPAGAAATSSSATVTNACEFAIYKFVTMKIITMIEMINNIK